MNENAAPARGLDTSQKDDERLASILADAIFELMKRDGSTWILGWADVERKARALAFDRLAGVKYEAPF